MRTEEKRNREWVVIFSHLDTFAHMIRLCYLAKGTELEFYLTCALVQSHGE